MNDAAERTLELLRECGALQEGHFVLSSGLHSNRYCQCAALFQHPDKAQEVAESARPFVGATGTDLVLAPALGGVLWGYELARALHVPSLFAERKEGAFALRRGFALEPGQRVLLAEDVVTTGGSVMELVPLVEAAGAEVVGIVSVVDRSACSFDPPMPFHALTTLDFETHQPDACPMCARNEPTDKPGSRPGAGASA